MHSQISLALVVLYYLMFFEGVSHINGDESVNFFIKAAKSKNIPRVGKRNKNASNEDFEKFFLKASKSVPRIGRRGSAPAAFVPVNSNGLTNVPYPYVHTDDPAKVNYPVWSEIAERFEYDPELLSSSELMTRLQQEMGEDLSVYECDKLRSKRTDIPSAQSEAAENLQM